MEAGAEGVLAEEAVSAVEVAAPEGAERPAVGEERQKWL